MYIYFDKYFYNSYAASAILLKRRIELDFDSHKGNYLVFSTTATYKGTSDEINKNNTIIKYGVKFNSVFKLYIGFLLYYIRNKKKIDAIISQSSPGFNILFFSIFPFRKKVTYIVQDIFPEGKLLALKISSLAPFFRPFLKRAYVRVGKVETISSDMRDYLLKSYNINAKLTYNPNPYPVKLSKNENSSNSQLKIGYSGNLSNSHGTLGPMKFLNSLDSLSKHHVYFIGFGKYFEVIRSKYQGLLNVTFGGSLPEDKYIKFIESLDALLIFQENRYEQFCLSCKFNSAIEFKRPIIYIGPKCDISRYLLKTKTGIWIDSNSDIKCFKNALIDFFNHFEVYRSNCNEIETVDLNRILNF
jgi:hypothetical protein